MSLSDHYIHAKFGIGEIYIQTSFSPILIEKLHQRAALSLDAKDNVIYKYASCDMVLIFHTKVPSSSLVYRFLKFLDEFIDKENFIRSNTLFNEEELFSTIKSKKFILITRQILSKEIDTA